MEPKHLPLTHTNRNFQLPTATPAESAGRRNWNRNLLKGPVAPIRQATITLLDENGQPAESVGAKS